MVGIQSPVDGLYNPRGVKNLALSPVVLLNGLPYASVTLLAKTGSESLSKMRGADFSMVEFVRRVFDLYHLWDHTRGEVTKGVFCNMGRIAMWIVVSACLLSAVACTRSDQALEKQMEELRRELADLRAKESTQKGTLQPAGPMQTSDTIPHPVSPGSWRAAQPAVNQGLPVVRLAPQTTPEPQRTAWTPSAPVAKALQPKKEKDKREKPKRNDIALPPPEVPPMVFQTLDEYGQVHGNAAVAPALRDDPEVALEPSAVERDVFVAGSRTPIDSPELVPYPNPSPYPARDEGVEAVEETPVLSVPKEVVLTAQTAPMTLVSSAAVERPSETLSPAESLYREGMDALRMKQYGEAKTAFERLLREAPEDGLADNALYWLGESNYDQGKYRDALGLFQDVLRRYPLGNKVPDAMVKVGLCFQNLGNRAQARQILEQVLAIYPESPAAAVAASRLPTM